MVVAVGVKGAVVVAVGRSPVLALPVPSAAVVGVCAVVGAAVVSLIVVVGAAAADVVGIVGTVIVAAVVVPSPH